MRAILLVLVILVGCEVGHCINEMCDDVCSRSATSDKSDYTKMQRCIKCIDDCKG